MEIKRSKEVYEIGDQRILVFSDLHCTKSFYKGKFERLKAIISQYDKVIINGDFFDNWAITFNEFVSSEWNKLFDLLKSKHTIYILGNHEYGTDQCLSNLDERVYNFCDEICLSKDLILKSGRIVSIEHGHLAWKDEFKSKLSVFGLFLIKRFELGNLIAIIYNFLMNFDWYIKFEKYIWGKYNYRFKKILQLDPDKYYVFGHIHYLDHDDNYYNSGYMIGKYFSYLTIENSTILLHEEFI